MDLSVFIDNTPLIGSCLGVGGDFCNEYNMYPIIINKTVNMAIGEIFFFIVTGYQFAGRSGWLRLRCKEFSSGWH